MKRTVRSTLEFAAARFQDDLWCAFFVHVVYRFL